MEIRNISNTLRDNSLNRANLEQTLLSILQFKVRNKKETHDVRILIRPIWPWRRGGVSRCVVMVEENFFLRQMGPFFLQFGVETAR